MQHRCRAPRTRLYRRTPLLVCHLRRIGIRMVGDHTPHGNLRLHRTRRTLARRDIQRLRTPDRHRRHSHGRCNRYHQVLGNHRAGCRTRTPRIRLRRTLIRTHPALAARHLHEAHRILHGYSTRGCLRILLGWSAPQLLAGTRGMGCCDTHRVPLHHRRRQRHSNRRHQPGQRNDTHDPHRSIGDLRCRRHLRHIRHRGVNDNRRCCMHRPLHGRRIRDRPQDRLLARHHTPQTGDLEIRWHTRIGSYCRWSYPPAR